MSAVAPSRADDDRLLPRPLNNADSQADRVAGAPDPAAVAVDGRDTAELLAFASRYGALIRFYDLDNVVRGDWSSFFSADPAVRLALHAALDLDDIERQLRRRIDGLRTAKTDIGRNVQRIIAMLARLIAILDRRLHHDDDVLESLRQRRRADGVSPALNRLAAHVHGDAGDERLWAERLIDGLLADLLEDVAAVVVAELRHGLAATEAELAAALRSGGHAPQAALWNAFVQMFGEARATLNAFPQRLLDFYYGDVLRQDGLPAQPDTVFLTFTTLAGTDEAAITAGTLFAAGVDPQGTAITYATDSTLTVTTASVAELSVHLVESKIHPTAGTTLATGVLSGMVALPAFEAGTAPFPLFGRTRLGPIGALDMQPASLGFTIASQTLMLTGGQRRIDLGLVLTTNEVDRFAPILQASDPAPQLARMIETAFSLYYSTAGGWMMVERFSVSTQSRTTEAGAPAIVFVLTITLPADAPPLVDPSSKLPAGATPPPLPASAFADAGGAPAIVGVVKPSTVVPQLSTSGSATAFTILSHLCFTGVTIDVSVAGLTPTSVSTPSGRADISQNFALFGLPPVKGAALTIAAPELFVKSLDSLSLSLGWAGLPVTSGGFQGYYQNYTLDADGLIATEPLFDNQSFMVAFDLVDPGLWSVDRTPLYLFRTEGDAIGAPDPAGTVSPQSQLIVPGIRVARPPAYYVPTAGALRLVLVAPDYAFGDALYSSNLMAASVRQSAAMSKAMRHDDAIGGGDAGRQLAEAAKANAAAAEKDYHATVATSVGRAISALTGQALATAKQAIAAGAEPDAQPAWRSSLDAALAQAAPSRPSFLSRWFGPAEADIAHALIDCLGSWIAGPATGLGARAAPLLDAAYAMLDIAADLERQHAEAAAGSAAAARPTLAASLAAARAKLHAAESMPVTPITPVMLPNPPWLPLANLLRIAYTASARSSIASVAGTDAGHDVTFRQVRLFGRVRPPRQTGAPVSLIPEVDPQAALYIKLSAAVPQISLLFILTAAPDGRWGETPTLQWEQYMVDRWMPINVVGDTTNGLLNTGIVSLSLRPTTVSMPRLRIRVTEGANNLNYVAAVIANAVTAHWIGPGGAAELGRPLPAGTITKAQASLPGIATIAQPMQSFGGRPPASGRGFALWMAERLRHKDRGIDGWDYARLVLAAIPSLWQVAVVPATDPRGLPAAGHVWVVPVAGPTTPNIADPTVPTVDSTILGEIHALLSQQISPFVDLAVTNPPYVRLTVTAELLFVDSNTLDHWQTELDRDLVAFLSPWPPEASLGPRPADYYTRHAVNEFVRNRPYVRGVVALRVDAPADVPGHGWHYYTSATGHALAGRLMSDPAKAVA